MAQDIRQQRHTREGRQVHACTLLWIVGWAWAVLQRVLPIRFLGHGLVGSLWVHAPKSVCPRCTTGQGSVRNSQLVLGYHWAVEHLSVCEVDLMRTAWRSMGVDATYLNAHGMVEAEQAGCAAAAVFALAEPDDPVVSAVVRAHEADLTGFYVDSARRAAACMCATLRPR